MNSRWARGLIALAALLAALVTARLGIWQLDRLEQKRSLQQAMDDRLAQPPLNAAELALTPEQAALQHHRQVELVGHWLPQHTVFLENRRMNGQAGFYVLTPLRLPDGSAVVVQRGWQPRDLRDRTLTQPVNTPEQALVSVRGRIAPPPARLFEFEAMATTPIRQNLDLQSYAREIGLSLRPLSLVQLQEQRLCADAQSSVSCEQPVSDGLKRDWPVVAADLNKHRGYAFQWFSLSALVLILYVWFQLIQPTIRRTR